MKINYQLLEKKINIKFKNRDLLCQSLTHKSFDSKTNNEKLEFLGDRVLGLVIAKKLLEIYPNEKEGILDKKFASLVNKNTCLEIAKNIKPSARGELEITDINNYFLKEKSLKVELMGKEFVWLDTGTQDSLLEASNFIKTIEKRQGLKIACIEEIALRKGYIKKSDLKKIINSIGNSNYSEYLKSLI